MYEGLRRAVADAAGREDVLAALAGVYGDVQAAVDLRRPICGASGRCCRFEEFGHRLLVSAIELAGFVADLRRLPSWPRLDEAMDGWSGLGCPFQVGRLCGVHGIRPLGCRIFFCDRSAAEWQREQHALFHARLKRLHDELEVPYFYIEWRQGLRAVCGRPEEVR